MTAQHYVVLQIGNAAMQIAQMQEHIDKIEEENANMKAELSRLASPPQE